MDYLKKIYPFLLIYSTLRIFTFFFSPNTPLHGANILNTIISALILIAALYFIIKKDERGWLIVAGEMILGGGGGFLQIGGINLRTLLLISTLTLYFLQNIKPIFPNLNLRFYKKNKAQENYFKNSLPILALFILSIFSAIIGLYHQHNFRAVYTDFIPYLFLLYYFPLRDLLKSTKFKNTALAMLGGLIIGDAILALLTFFGFIDGVLLMQDAFYHWYRDVALGKITPISTGFYRLTLDEHLLIAPILIILAGKIISQKIEEKKEIWQSVILFSLLLVIMGINITRIYIIAAAFAFLFLFKKEYLQKWIKCALMGMAIFLISFCFLNLNASKGKNLGFELLGLRFGGIASPQTEDSAWSRALLLPKILEKIKTRPFLGQGLGDTVAVYSPVLKQNITTPHFDWGYLEIMAEMGIIGFLIWMSAIGALINKIIKSKDLKKYFLFPALLSLLVINLTSPALFHQLGIIFIVFLWALINQKNYDTN